MKRKYQKLHFPSYIYIYKSILQQDHTRYKHFLSKKEIIKLNGHSSILACNFKQILLRIYNINIIYIVYTKQSCIQIIEKSWCHIQICIIILDHCQYKIIKGMYVLHFSIIYFTFFNGQSEQPTMKSNVLETGQSRGRVEVDDT